MVNIGIPQVDFYSMLSGLGDTLQKNAGIRQQQQRDQLRQAAFSQLDPNSADFGKVAMTGALGLLKGGDIEGGTKLLTMAQAQNERDHQHAREAVQDKHWAASYAIQKAAADRAAAEDENTPYQYSRNPNFGQPGHEKDPEWIDNYAAAKAAGEANAPGGGGLSLTPVYGVDSDEKSPTYGQTVLLQPGKNGVAVKSTLPPGVSLSGFSPDTIAADATRLRAGDDSVLKKYSNRGQGAVDMRRLNNEVTRQQTENNETPTDLTQNKITLAGDTARERAAGNQEGKMVPASIEAQGAMKIAENSSDNLWRTQSKTFNKGLQVLEDAFSYGPLKAAKTAYNTAVMTYSKAITPTGVGTVDAQQHAREVLDTADGPEATKAAFAQLRREVDMAHASPTLARQYFAAVRKARLEGKPIPEVPQYAPAAPTGLQPTPDAIDALKKDPRRAADFDAYYGSPDDPTPSRTILRGR